MSKTEEALMLIKPKARQQSIKQIVSEVLSGHASETVNGITYIHCTQDCLAKEIARKINYIFEDLLWVIHLK